MSIKDRLEKIEYQIKKNLPFTPTDEQKVSMTHSILYAQLGIAADRGEDLTAASMPTSFFGASVSWDPADLENNKYTITLGSFELTQDADVEFVKEIPSQVTAGPTIDFGDSDIEIEGAESAINLKYDYAGQHNDRPYYLSTGGDYKIYSYNFGETTDSFWLIDLSSNSFTPESPNSVLYYNYTFIPQSQESMFPIYDQWYIASTDVESNLTLKMYPFHPEYNFAVGNPIVVWYNFIGENPEGTSIYQWYRCDTIEDEGVIISGAINRSYTPVADDLNKYLKVEITPIDSLENVGDAVKSGSTEIIIDNGSPSEM